ncbi:MAG: hypothetical protein AAGF78_11170 [Pseudomonadota bacterium]
MTRAQPPLDNVTDNVTDIRPALDALLARMREAAAACAEIGPDEGQSVRRAAEDLAVLHAEHAEEIERLMGDPSPAGSQMPRPFARVSAADVLEGGALPARLAVLEDRVLRALDRAMLLDHAEPAAVALVQMKADLVALHDRIGLQ